MDHTMYQKAEHVLLSSGIAQCIPQYEVWTLQSAVQDCRSRWSDALNPLVTKRQWHCASVFRLVDNNADAPFLEPATGDLFGHERTGEATALSASSWMDKFVMLLQGGSDLWCGMWIQIQYREWWSWCEQLICCCKLQRYCCVQAKAVESARSDHWLLRSFFWSG